MSPEGQEAARHDMGACESITAESEGPPGERHFRIRVAAAKGVATLWLEKEQLQELGLTIKQLLGSEPAGEESAPPDAPSERSGANFDFKVARLAVGLHRERGLYLILVHDTPGEREPATLAIWVSPRQLGGFAEQALEVCAAGRPRCHLCGAPINEDEAHACPHSNGHVHV